MKKICFSLVALIYILSFSCTKASATFLDELGPGSYLFYINDGKLYPSIVEWVFPDGYILAKTGYSFSFRDYYQNFIDIEHKHLCPARPYVRQDTTPPVIEEPKLDLKPKNIVLEQCRHFLGIERQYSAGARSGEACALCKRKAQRKETLESMDSSFAGGATQED